MSVLKAQLPAFILDFETADKNLSKDVCLF